MDRLRVGIIIPAFNEEASIGNIVHQCLNYGIPIVVDDGSSDRTCEISKNEGADIIKHEVNLGYDEALNSGFRKASDLGCEFVVTLDADGQHNPELIGKYVDLLDKGADVVIGIRDKKARFSEHCFAFLTRHLYGISDPLCGLKGYRMSVYHTLGHFDSYGSIGSELTLFAARNDFQLIEVPIIVRERNGQPRFGRIFYANCKIFRAMILSLI